MEKRKFIIGITIVCALSWAFPLYSLIYNRLHPSFETALGVAYGFLAGAIVHTIGIIFWLILRRRNTNKIEVVTLLISFTTMVALLFLSDSGALSSM